MRIWNRQRSYGTPEQCFLAFFDEMDGSNYKRWREAWEQAHATTIYEILRCGLVHEYQPKLDSAFWIGDGQALGLAEENSTLIFKVEPYYRHFCAESDRLYEELKRLPDPQIPPPHLKTPKRGGVPIQTPLVLPPATPTTRCSS